jgi:hypothetical protein
MKIDEVAPISKKIDNRIEQGMKKFMTYIKKELRLPQVDFDLKWEYDPPYKARVIVDYNSIYLGSDKRSFDALMEEIMAGLKNKSGAYKVEEGDSIFMDTHLISSIVKRGDTVSGDALMSRIEVVAIWAATTKVYK